MHPSTCTHANADKPRRGPNTRDGFPTLQMDCKDCQTTVHKTMPKGWGGQVVINIGVGANVTVFV